jgi:hypothetical protein
MADVARIPRRRGGLCGLALIVLGAWGGLAPFIGPYLHFGYTPDSAWHYTQGRLYLSAVPGGVALLAGLLMAVTRSRTAGVIGGLAAALAGAWFLLGNAILGILLNHPSISPGTPLARSFGGMSLAKWQLLEQIGVFVGVGILILFFGSIAIGRFSMLSHRDAADADDDDDDFGPSLTSPTPATSSLGTPVTSTTGYPGASGTYPGTGQYPSGTRPFPGDEPTGQFPAPTTGQFPTTTGRFPGSPGGTATPSGQFPPEATRSNGD